VISSQTVKHIPTLHAEFGPTRLEGHIPAILKRVGFAKVGCWQWIGFAILVSAGVLLGWLTQKSLDLVVRPGWPWVRTIAEALKGPGSMALGLWAFYLLARGWLGLARPILTALDPLCIAVL